MLPCTLPPRDPHRRHARNGKASRPAEALFFSREYPTPQIFNSALALGPDFSPFPRSSPPLTSNQGSQAFYSSRPHPNRPTLATWRSVLGHSGARSGGGHTPQWAPGVAAGARGIPDGPVGAFRCPGLSMVCGAMRQVSCDAYLWVCLIRACGLGWANAGVWGRCQMPRLPAGAVGIAYGNGGLDSRGKPALASPFKAKLIEDQKNIL